MHYLNDRFMNHFLVNRSPKFILKQPNFSPFNIQVLKKTGMFTHLRLFSSIWYNLNFWIYVHLREWVWDNCFFTSVWCLTKFVEEDNESPLNLQKSSRMSAETKSKFLKVFQILFRNQGLMEHFVIWYLLSIFWL